MKNTKINQRDSNDEKFGAHNIAVKTYRKKKYANLILGKVMIEDVLFNFKRT